MGKHRSMGASSTRCDPAPAVRRRWDFQSCARSRLSVGRHEAVVRAPGSACPFSCPSRLRAPRRASAARGLPGRAGACLANNGRRAGAPTASDRASPSGWARASPGRRGVGGRQDPGVAASGRVAERTGRLLGVHPDPLEAGRRFGVDREPTLAFLSVVPRSRRGAPLLRRYIRPSRSSSKGTPTTPARPRRTRSCPSTGLAQ
jgi:hypothetical protein